MIRFHKDSIELINKMFNKLNNGEYKIGGMPIYCKNINKWYNSPKDFITNANKSVWREHIISTVTIDSYSHIENGLTTNTFFYVNICLYQYKKFSEITTSEFTKIITSHEHLLTLVSLMVYHSEDGHYEDSNNIKQVCFFIRKLSDEYADITRDKIHQPVKAFIKTLLIKEEEVACSASESILTAFWETKEKKNHSFLIQGT